MMEVCIALLELYYSHQQPSYQPPQAFPEHPSGPPNTCQARLQSPSASFAFAGVRLHAEVIGDQTLVSNVFIGSFFVVLNTLIIMHWN